MWVQTEKRGEAIHSRSHKEQMKELQPEPSSDSRTRALNYFPSQPSKGPQGPPQIKPLAPLGLRPLPSKQRLTLLTLETPLALLLCFPSPSTLPSWPTLPSSSVPPPTPGWIFSLLLSLSFIQLASSVPALLSTSVPVQSVCPALPKLHLSSRGAFAKASPTLPRTLHQNLHWR